MENIRLEYEDRMNCMPDRLTHAAQRILEYEDGKQIENSTHVLRSEQVGVFKDFAEYLRETADTSVSDQGVERGRIILPPRTGKTVIAGQIIAAARMITTFIVPTKALVDQTVRAFREQLPNIPIGSYFSESKDLVMWGVNVTTYNMLQAAMTRDGYLPAQIAVSSLVFMDEGHRSMTEKRQELLQSGFEKHVVQVALTATPNYNATRRLENFYPKLIHKISLAEAVELEMVASIKVWVAEVDVDASTVRMVAGDYNEEELSEIMSAAPFFEAARQFRYDPDNLGKSALFCCVSRQQAYELRDFLLLHRPQGAPVPGLIIQETLTGERRRILDEFEKGHIDTLINVGILLEGWSSPRCKLLVDLAPTVSRVRATQKFFRPATKWGFEEARVYMLLPKNLSVKPVMPTDLFSWAVPEYRDSVLVTFHGSDEEERDKYPKPVKPKSYSEVEKVEVKQKLLFERKFEKPELNPDDPDQVEWVLTSHSLVSEDEIPGYHKFRSLYFNHTLFVGRGVHLLRYCGVEANRFDYIEFMARYLPYAASDLYYNDHNYTGQHNRSEPGSCEEDTTRMRENLHGGSPVKGYAEGYLALGGHLEEQETDTEKSFVRECLLPEVVDELIGRLTARERVVVVKYYGLCGERCQTQKEIGQYHGLSVTRVGQIRAKALRKMGVPTHVSEQALELLELLGT